MDALKNVEEPRDAKPHATFVARNCKPSNERNEYVKAIDKVIGVFAPSNCFKNMDWPQCGDRECTKVEVISEYKIQLAFENGNSPGYVTEKIFQAMQAGVLPVYMGTVDVANIIPKGSYIDVADFNTPKDVANYLKKVLENEALYESYFEWKHKPFDPEFEVVNRVLWEVDHYCRVCRYVDAMQRGVKWDHLHQRAVDRIPGKLVSEVSEEKTTEETLGTKSIEAIEGIKSEKNIIVPNELNLDYNTPKRDFHEFEGTTNTFNLALFWVVPAVLCLLFIIRRKFRKMLRF